MKAETKYKKKLKEIKRIVSHAMNDKPIWKPVKGFTYIEDVAVGQLVETEVGGRAVVMDSNSSATVVLVINANHIKGEDKNFYLGKHRWGNKTEVKVIGD